jgi:hypothetical protein
MRDFAFFIAKNAFMLLYILGFIKNIYIDLLAKISVDLIAFE